VNGNGGEARYEHGYWGSRTASWRILVRQPNGEMAYVAPGDYVVQGDPDRPELTSFTWPNHDVGATKQVTVFTVHTAAAFEQRCAPAPAPAVDLDEAREIITKLVASLDQAAALPALAVHAAEVDAAAAFRTAVDFQLPRLVAALAEAEPVTASAHTDLWGASLSDAIATADAAHEQRAIALADLEQVLALALQAMAENDCCADPDDPDWRGPAIEQFRADLISLGATPAELDAAGIKTHMSEDVS
jgi:hypothetical protein